MTLALRQPETERRVRVMLVDDSAIVRGFLRRWLEDDARIALVKICSDGQQAVAEIERARPDVIVLDAGMPGIDGFVALSQLRRIAPATRIVMTAPPTVQGAEDTARALQLGAADFIVKPQPSSTRAVDDYHRELVEKVVVLGQANAASRKARRFDLRQPPANPSLPSVLLVTAGMGGFAAIPALLSPIARRIQAPILIAPQMPGALAAAFAGQLESLVGKRCREAGHGDLLADGCMLVAPGDRRVHVARGPGGRIVTLESDAPDTRRGPMFDPLLETAAASFGNRVLAVMLTGMGEDGREGARSIVAAGGRVIVQDESTSLAWGAPGAVAAAGLAEAVKPLKDLSALALRMMNGDAA